jgi:hypothetical protein
MIESYLSALQHDLGLLLPVSNFRRKFINVLTAKANMIEKP